MSFLFKNARFGNLDDVSSEHVFNDNDMISTENYKAMQETIQSLRKWTKYGLVLLLVLQAVFAAVMAGLHLNCEQRATEENANDTPVASNTLSNVTSSLARKKERIEKVAFSVSITEHIHNPDRQAPLRYSRVYINIGGGYDPDTGKFTCPTAGTYVISYSCMAPPGELFQKKLMLNSTGIANCWSDSRGTSGYQTHTGTICIDLNKGDEVYVSVARLSGANRVWGHRYNMLTGYMLYMTEL